jgi:hypothetical protein
MTPEAMWGAAAAAAAVVVVGIGAAVVLTTSGQGQDSSQVEVVNATDAPITPPTNPVAVTIVTTVPSATTSTVATTTTISSTTSTLAPTTTVATTLALPPGRLVAAATDLDLGLDRTEGAIAIGNSGGQPIDWATSSDNALVEATRGGTLAPGTQTDVTITVSRAGLIEGEYLAVVSVLGGGRGVPITVRWRVERAPVVRVSVAPAGLADAATCPADTADLTGAVAAAVIDESPLASVVMGWSGPGEGGSGALGETEPGTWVAPLGPLSGAGSWTVMVTATDARGNVGTGATTLLVTACPP